MTDRQPIDEPSPTIVGPRPPEGASGRKVTIPRGIERLVTLAGLSAEWRAKVLVDPVAAAQEAEIDLAASEGAVIRAVPPAALAGMIDGMAKSRGWLPSTIGTLTAGAAKVAAAALLVTGLAAAGTDSPSAKGGARADAPQPKPPDVGVPAPTGVRPDVPQEAPAILWMASLDDALAQAMKTQRAVMAVFLPDPTAAAAEPQRPIVSRGISAIAPQPTSQQSSLAIILGDTKDIRVAVRNANLIAVRVSRPVAPINPKSKTELTEAEQAALKAYEASRAAYDAAVKRCGITAFPTVAFLAPDGSPLSRLVQPNASHQLAEAAGAVPPLLAKWMVANGSSQTQPSPTRGIQPDVPGPVGGARPDAPK